MNKLNATSLKWIAIIAMIIDHVAWKLQAPALILEIMHCIGRFTIPIMCFFIAEGFHNTRSVRKYAGRLLVFALISQIPFTYFMTGRLIRFWLGPETFNVLFVLLLGLLALHVIKGNQSKIRKVILVTLCFIGSLFCDWLFYAILFILAFGLNYGNRKKQMLWFSYAALFCFVLLDLPSFLTGGSIRFMEAGLFFTIPLLLCYNGEKSTPNSPSFLTNKWIFYILYPLHLMIIAYVSYVIPNL
jgi:hypothetical protein